MKNITGKQMKVLLKAQQAELNAVVMYQKMADRIENPEIAAGLREIAQDEGRHAAAFRKLTQKTLTPKNSLANMVVFMMKVVGEKMLFPIIARREYAAINSYAPVVKDFPELIDVQQDEGRHGDRISELVKML